MFFVESCTQVAYNWRTWTSCTSFGQLTVI